MGKPSTWVIFSLLLMVNLAIVGYLVYQQNYVYKTGYVYIEKVYDSYKGKAATEKELKVMEARQKNLLDTLNFQILNLENNLKTSASGDPKMKELLMVKKGDYNRLVEEFSQYNETESGKHVNQLLNQINGYIQDYGKQNHYKYIFGAMGNGSLMYAEEGSDLTKDLINYVNQRYEGK